MNKYRIIIFFAACASGLGFIHCDDKLAHSNGPVYKSGANVIYNGSIYFNQAGCAGCHADLKKFESAAASKKTPLDYFKTVSGEKTSGKHKGQSYQAFTDRGRWSMVHFLKSLAPGVQDDPATKGNEIREYEAKLARDADEIRTAYERNNRRWPMGYKDIGSRPGTPAINGLLQDANVQEEGSATPISNARKLRPYIGHPGYTIYQSNCARCHGQYAEASTTAVRIGLIECKDRKRQCGVYLGTGDLTAGDVKNVHHAAGQNLPQFASFTEDDWSDLTTYIATLSDQ